MTTSFRRIATATACAACVSATVAGADAVETLRHVNGHMSIGYAHLSIAPKDQQATPPETPSGSLSMGAGVDYPITPAFSLGVALDYDLLGGLTVQRGSLFANVDYSILDAALLAHLVPRGLGPLGRLSLGPALVRARSDLSSSSTGAGFADLAVSETAAGAAFDATLIRRSTAPVRVGLEIGVRMAFLEHARWTIGAARLVFHY